MPDAPSDLDIRVGALTQEYEAQIATLARRCAGLASELASTQSKLKALQEAQSKLKALQEAQKELKALQEEQKELPAPPPAE